MPAVQAPYGLVPVKKLGSRYDTGGQRSFPIASAYGTGIFFGDVVKLNQSGTGYLEKDTGTATATPVGVFLGCEYTDPSLGYKVQRQNWPAGTVASDAVAFVCDDPEALFSVALVSSGTTISGSAITALLGKNAALVQNSGSTVNGKSGVAISGLAVTATLPIRVIDVVRGSEDASGNYTAVLVTWNAGMHQYNKALGL